MPKEKAVTHSPSPNATVVIKMRVSVADHEELAKLHEKLKTLFPSMTLADLFRESVHEGLPAVDRRYTGALAGAAQK